MSDLSSCIGAAAEAALASATELNHLDAQAGDGDLGVTVSTGARLVLEVLPDLEQATPADALRLCGSLLARKTPSTCGTLVATGLLRAARSADQGIAANAVAQLLDAACAGIAERGKAELGSKTMLDALAPAADAAREAAARGEALGGQLVAAAEAADRGAARTKEMVPRHGRAGWLAERSAGHEDGGARLIAILLAAAAQAAVEPQEPEGRK